MCERERERESLPPTAVVSLAAGILGESERVGG